MVSKIAFHECSEELTEQTKFKKNFQPPAFAKNLSGTGKVICEEYQ